MQTLPGSTKEIVGDEVYKTQRCNKEWTKKKKEVAQSINNIISDSERGNVFRFNMPTQLSQWRWVLSAVLDSGDLGLQDILSIHIFQTRTHKEGTLEVF